MAQRWNGHRAATWAVLAFACGWCWVCGNRGLFPLDQSIVLDGAWRIASGQVPFVDFITPHGVTVMWMQAALFRVFGAGYDVYVALAALMNVLATALAMVLVRRLLPEHRGLELLAGALTAIWFYPIFGTPYSEQTSFLFSLAGLVATVEGCRRSGRPRWGLLVGAGVCAWLAFLTKQNAGGLFLPVYGVTLLLFVERRWMPMARSAAALGMGFLGGVATFGVWLAGYSDGARFWDSYFTTPSGLLHARIVRDLPEVLIEPWFGAGRGPTKIVLFFWLLVLLVALVKRPSRPLFRAAVLCGTLLLFQNLFNLTSQNTGENGFPYIGIITALTLGIATGMRWNLSVPGSRAWRLVGGLLVLVLGVRGVEVGWSRIAHDTMYPSVYSARIDRPGFRHLRWSRDLDIGHAVIPAADVQRLVAHLEGDGRTFFVFPDFTWLYLALERPSPQPILWFHRGLTYPAGESAVDAWIVRSLEDRQVEVIVLEEQSFVGPLDARLADFPRLTRYIENGFEETARFGIFVVLEKVR